MNLMSLFIGLSFASSPQGIEIFSDSTNQQELSPKADSRSPNQDKIQKHQNSIKNPLNPGPRVGNIPDYFLANKTNGDVNSKIVLSSEVKQEKLTKLRAGDLFEAEVLHSVIAFPDEHAPVVAILKTGPLRGAQIFGRSMLEKNSKRIFIDFEKISFDNSTFEVKGSALSDLGSLGLSGEYHSREAEYFAGDFGSSFVAAYFDSQVPRNTNVFGQTQEEQTVDAAMKKGLAAGAMSSAERFKEKLKHVPEYSEIHGPIKIKVIFSEAGSRL